jgi:hypothetical protein
MSQDEGWHWTHEPVPRKLKGMTATQIRPATRLSPLLAGIRTAVESHADWAETAQLGIHRVHNTAEETATSIHIYGTDITRVGSSARRYYG